MTIKKIIKLGAAATAAALVAVMLCACQATHAVETFVSGEPCKNGPDRLAGSRRVGFDGCPA